MIEIAVTLSILGLLMAAVLPSVSEWIRNTHVRTMAESIQNGLKKAKAEALRRNKVVTFWMVTPATAPSLDSTCALSSVSGSWVISTADPTGKCDVAPSPTGILESLRLMAPAPTPRALRWLAWPAMG